MLSCGSRKFEPFPAREDSIVVIQYVCRHAKPQSQVAQKMLVRRKIALQRYFIKEQRSKILRHFAHPTSIKVNPPWQILGARDVLSNAIIWLRDGSGVGMAVDCAVEGSVGWTANRKGARGFTVRYGQFEQLAWQKQAMSTALPIGRSKRMGLANLCL